MNRMLLPSLHAGQYVFTQSALIVAAILSTTVIRGLILDHGVVFSQLYASMATQHGTIMVLLGFVLGASFFVELPTLTGRGGVLSAALILAAVLSAIGSADVNPFGWTMYPPLSTTSSGLITYQLWSLFLVGLFTYIGVGYVGLPRVSVAAIDATKLTAHLSILGWIGMFLIPILTCTWCWLVADTGGCAGDWLVPYLYEQTFWVFGHPIVYWLVLPVFMEVSILLRQIYCQATWWAHSSAVFSRLILFVVSISVVVWGHHLFSANVGFISRSFFIITSMAVIIPMTANLLGWVSSIGGYSAVVSWISTPLRLGIVLGFALGGVTGVILAAHHPDAILHDTFFVVGHFHLFMAGFFWGCTVPFIIRFVHNSTPLVKVWSVATYRTVALVSATHLLLVMVFIVFLYSGVSSVVGRRMHLYAKPTQIDTAYISVILIALALLVVVVLFYNFSVLVGLFATFCNTHIFNNTTSLESFDCVCASRWLAPTTLFLLISVIGCKFRRSNLASGVLPLLFTDPDDDRISFNDAFITTTTYILAFLLVYLLYLEIYPPVEKAGSGEVPGSKAAEEIVHTATQPTTAIGSDGVNHTGVLEIVDSPMNDGVLFSESLGGAYSPVIVPVLVVIIILHVCALAVMLRTWNTTSSCTAWAVVIQSDLIPYQKTTPLDLVVYGFIILAVWGGLFFCLDTFFAVKKTTTAGIGSSTFRGIPNEAGSNVPLDFLLNRPLHPPLGSYVRDYPAAVVSDSLVGDVMANPYWGLARLSNAAEPLAQPVVVDTSMSAGEVAAAVVIVTATVVVAWIYSSTIAEVATALYRRLFSIQHSVSSSDTQPASFEPRPTVGCVIQSTSSEEVCLAQPSDVVEGLVEIGEITSVFHLSDQPTCSTLSVFFLLFLVLTYVVSLYTRVPDQNAGGSGCTGTASETSHVLDSRKALYK